MNRRVFLKSNTAALAFPLVWALGDPLTPRPLLFGAGYYPDQTEERLWAEDARMMSTMGITNVRVAEFAWVLMEPSEGQFGFGWLHRAVNLLHAHNIAVILGDAFRCSPALAHAEISRGLRSQRQGSPTQHESANS